MSRQRQVATGSPATAAHGWLLVDDLAMQLITSRDNPRLKLVRKLRSGGRALRRKVNRSDSVPESTWLLLEGRHLLETALDLRRPLDTVLVDVEKLTDFRELTKRSLEAGSEVVLVESKLLDEAADSDAPQGVLGLARHQAQPLPEAGSLVGRVLFLDGVQDPGNVGAVVRSAAAAGCSAIFAGEGTCAWWHPRALRASAGAALRLPLHWNTHLPRLVDVCPRPWIGLEAHHGESLWEVELPNAGTLVLGSESHGLSEATLEQLQLRLTVPLQSNVESLNATVAASLVLFEWQRQKLHLRP